MENFDDEKDLRVADAQEHDTCMVMIADDGGRPLMMLSIDDCGRGLIEAKDEDLPAGIRQLNKILSQALRGQPVSAIQVRGDGC